MKLISIELNDFRNYQHEKINFGPHKNLFIGNNAQGKTNLLEAIYLICLSKSFRTAHEKEAIQFTKKQFVIRGEFELDNGNPRKVVLVCSRDKGKELSVNRKRITRVSEFIGTLPVIISSPEDYDLTIGPPPKRRRFVDILLSQINKKYIHLIIEYQRILKQKNAILLKWKLNGKGNDKILNPWNEQLIDTGSKIIEFRHQFSEQLSKKLEKIYLQLISDKEKLHFFYQPNLCYQNLSDIKTQFEDKLYQIYGKEIQRGVSLIGPHRDDYLFKINGKDVKKFGSRGQHKSVLIALAITEYHLIKNISRESPIILIDDLYSELDSEREYKIVDSLEALGQIFITATEIRHEDNNSLKVKKFFIENGIVREE